MFVITITSQIMFQRLILTFDLIIDLKMKRRIHFSFDFNVMTYDRSIFIDEQTFFIQHDVFYF